MLPLGSSTSIRTSPMEQQEKWNHATRDHVPMRCNHWRCKEICQHYSRLQRVYNAELGLINHTMQTYQDMWNTTKGMPIEEGMDYAVSVSCAMKAIVHHHLYMKTGSGCNRTFPDCVMTFAFGWGKTDIQNRS